MNCVSNFQGAQAGGMAGQKRLPASWFGGYERTRSFSAYESLDAGLTIKTDEVAGNGRHKRSLHHVLKDARTRVWHMFDHNINKFAAKDTEENLS
ncbi:MAG: hypothetical protein JRI80_10320 [Deltaproteobacteria bacterium]|nr:hypothetical protein [Deltaproteobacteria bacterium]